MGLFCGVFFVVVVVALVVLICCTEDDEHITAITWLQIYFLE